MNKIKGIKSVDVTVSASGHGVVNWNGSTELKGHDNTTYNNHTLPKLRGYTPLSGVVSDKGYNFRKEPIDIDFKLNPLYISQNCIRHHLFRDHAFDLAYASTQEHFHRIIASQTGLIRGFVIPNKSYKRTSPLLVEDFIEQTGNGNFEQFGKAGFKNNNSIFSKTTFGDTEYIGRFSINIEDLQFISLDQKFDRPALIVAEYGEGQQVADEIVAYLKTIDDTKNPTATYHPNYVRKGTILHQGEVGILLNQDAISILVEYTIESIKNLFIKQGKGYMMVDELKIDYNDTNRTMRMKKDEGCINPVPTDEYAIYYVAEEPAPAVEEKTAKKSSKK